MSGGDVFIPQRAPDYELTVGKFRVRGYVFSTGHREVILTLGEPLSISPHVAEALGRALTAVAACAQNGPVPPQVFQS